VSSRLSWFGLIFSKEWPKILWRRICQEGLQTFVLAGQQRDTTLQCGDPLGRIIPDPASGMLIDLGFLERALEDARDALDHRFLDEVENLGPATMENLSAWIWRRLAPSVSGLARVTVYRDSSGDMCSYFGPDRRMK
jgi:hypothetical protein